MGVLLNQNTCTIANGASLSGALYCGDKMPCEIVMPASWTTAALTFQRSYDGVTFTNAYDDSGNEITVQAAAGRSVAVTPGDFSNARYIKIRSGTSGAAVNQAADRTLTVNMRKFL